MMGVPGKPAACPAHLVLPFMDEGGRVHAGISLNFNVLTKIKTSNARA